MSSKMKVLLIFPPITRPEDFSAKEVRIRPFPPLGLACITAVLEEDATFDVKILDALISGNLDGEPYSNSSTRYGLNDEKIEQEIRNENPDVLGVSCIFSALEWDSLNLCTIAKRVNKKIVTVLGGPHAGATGLQLLRKCSDCDFIIIGEGELSFKELLYAIKNNKNESIDVDGLVYRYKGEIICNPKTKYIVNLDSLPLPARHLLAMEKYFEIGAAHSSYKNKPFTPLLSSRGCPAKCTFCAIANHWGENQRTRSAKHVLDEIEVLVNRYGVKEIHFEDDNLTADKKRALEIFDGIIKRGFNISWTVPSGMAVYSLDEELLIKMKESGCFSVSLAIENGNQEIVTKVMRKPVNLKKVAPLVKIIKELDMDARGFFIIGYPDETKATIEETLNFARELELDWAYFSIFAPLPGTEIYDTCIQKGYMKESDFDPVRSFYRPVIETPEFDQLYLREIRQKANLDINFENNVNLRKYDIDKAITSFKNVVDLYPDFDYANFYLAEAYLKKGLVEKAIVYYHKTLAINSEYDRAKYRLSTIQNV
jgi:anaerobic magnesium-protoporphyrin IX monomethyl ester cyclase